MKRRRHAAADLYGHNDVHLQAAYFSNENFSSSEYTYIRLRSRLGLISSVPVLLLFSSLGVLVVVVTGLLRSSTPTSLVATNVLRSEHVQSDREITLQVLQLLSGHDAPLPRAYIQALEASSSASAHLAQIRDSDDYIEYKASRGLGHRLTRAAAAYHLAKRLGVGLRQDWGKCPAWNSNSTSGVDLWRHLFVSESRVYSDREKDASANAGQHMTISNEVPGYKPYATRQLRESGLARSLFESNMEFYRTLRNHFFANHCNLFRSFVRSGGGRKYVDRSNFIVVGLHIRTGNGEVGEFVEKKRVIENSNLWTRHIVPIVVRYVKEERLKASQGGRDKKKPLIFIATDTPSIIESIRQLFAENDIEVISNSQQIDEAVGPSYLVKDRRCLKAWELQMIDMVLLSLSDVIVAGRYSSFTQTMPLSLLFSDRRSNRIVGDRPYCELERDAASMSCFRTYQGWVGRKRKQNPQRIVYNADGVLEGGRQNLSVVDGHEDGLVYPMAPRDCLERSSKYYLDNKGCLAAHLLCGSDIASCK